MELNKQILSYMIEDKYATAKELSYSNEVGLYLTPIQYKNYLVFISNLKEIKTQFLNVLDLKPYNNKKLFFAYSQELEVLRSNFTKIALDDYKDKNSFLGTRNMNAIMRSRVYSEIEGTLNIEAVPTTRKKIDDIIAKKKEPVDKNDIIIKNMSEAIDYVNTKPSFNKKNLLKLYKILSNNCLPHEDEIKEGQFYRDDEVEIDGYNGCPSNKIDDCMQSLFKFVNSNLNNKDMFYLLPHIVHYYIVYIHPYFDYNGRTARMVSLWVSILSDNDFLPMTVSEAIDQTKNNYYSALRETRDSENDLTYFLIYIFKISINYFLTYENIEDISCKLQNNGIILTENDKGYLKKILICSQGVFSHKDFLKYCNIDISKQAALNILNSFVEYGLLNVEETKSKIKLFSINQKTLKYRLTKL